jgi:hypothetical protein
VPFVVVQGTQPFNGAYTPGNPISVTFNEEVDCVRPYKFSASLLIAALTPVTVIPGMLCVFNRIELQIPASVVVSCISFCETCWSFKMCEMSHPDATNVTWPCFCRAKTVKIVGLLSLLFDSVNMLFSRSCYDLGSFDRINSNECSRL